MQPCQPDRATSFGPDALKVMCKAFDEAWIEIAPKVSSEPIAVAWARTSLARIVLGLADADTARRDGHKTLAVAAFCAVHRIDNAAADPHPLRLDLSRSSAIRARAT